MKISFTYCPSCGSKSPVSTSSSSRETVQTATPATSATTPSSTTLTRVTRRPSFEEFKKGKEADASSFRKKGSKKPKPEQPVTIQIGVMNEDESLRRGESLPLKVLPSATADQIREAAEAKHKSFNRKFNAKKMYKLVFRDGGEVRAVPGTNPEEPFTLQRYKEESGFGYARIVLYLMEKGNFINALKRVIKSESSDSSDDEENDDVLPVYAVKLRHVSNDQPIVNEGHLSSQPSTSSAFSELELCSPSTSYEIECPTCFKKFPIAEVADHADVCAENLLDTDSDEMDEGINQISNISLPGPTNKEQCIKSAIESLRKRYLQLDEDPVRITVRRKSIWEDYRRARKMYYNPTRLLKVTFSTEPAVDDGGPKREFFAGNSMNNVKRAHHYFHTSIQ
jgi:hypothetical protein